MKPKLESYLMSRLHNLNEIREMIDPRYIETLGMTFGQMTAYKDILNMLRAGMFDEDKDKAEE